MSYIGYQSLLSYGRTFLVIHRILALNVQVSPSLSPPPCHDPLLLLLRSPPFPSSSPLQACHSSCLVVPLGGS